jgi:hypothetical protein
MATNSLAQLFFLFSFYFDFQRLRSIPLATLGNITVLTAKKCSQFLGMQ